MAEQEERTAGEGWAHAFTLQLTNGTVYPPRVTKGANRVTTKSMKILDVAAIKGIVYGRDDDTFVPEKTFTQKNWIQMGEDMSKFVNLKTISLDGLLICNRDESPQGDGSETLSALFDGGRDYQFRLEELRLSNAKIYIGCGSGPRDEAIVKMVPFIESMSSLKVLDLSHNDIEDHGARQICRAIQGHRIEKLYLEHNFIWDDGIACILNSACSRHFVELHIHHNRSYVKKGRNAIMSFLSREDNAIESFGVDCKDYKYAKRLIESIPKTSKLVELVGPIGSGHEKSISSIAPCLGSLICDTSSIDALCHSNHRLREIGNHTDSYLQLANRYAYSPYKSVGEALRIQQRGWNGASEAEIVREKIRTLYFDGEFDVQLFVDMDVALMPRLLSLVTRKVFLFDDDAYHSDRWRPRSGAYEVPGDNLNAVYRLVRHCHIPDMFSFTSPKVQIASLVAENESLKGQNERLAKEVAELRARLASSPKKRAKRTKS